MFTYRCDKCKKEILDRKEMVSAGKGTFPRNRSVCAMREAGAPLSCARRVARRWEREGEANENAKGLTSVVEVKPSVL